MTFNDWRALGFEHATNGRPYNPPQHGPIMQAYSAGYDEGKHAA